MILGMSLATFTSLHTALSLIGIVAGLVVAYGMLSGRKVDQSIPADDCVNQRDWISISG